MDDALASLLALAWWLKDSEKAEVVKEVERNDNVRKAWNAVAGEWETNERTGN